METADGDTGLCYLIWLTNWLSSTPQPFLEKGSNCFTYTEVAVTLEIVKFQSGLGLLAPLTSLRQMGSKGVISDECFVK